MSAKEAQNMLAPNRPQILMVASTVNQPCIPAPPHQNRAWQAVKEALVLRGDRDHKDRGVSRRGRLVRWDGIFHLFCRAFDVLHPHAGIIWGTSANCQILGGFGGSNPTSNILLFSLYYWGIGGWVDGF